MEAEFPTATETLQRSEVGKTRESYVNDIPCELAKQMVKWFFMSAPYYDAIKHTDTCARLHHISKERIILPPGLDLKTKTVDEIKDEIHKLAGQIATDTLINLGYRVTVEVEDTPNLPIQWWVNWGRDSTLDKGAYIEFKNRIPCLINIMK